MVVWEAVWRPFGEALPHEASTIENNLRFPGQYYDEETGFHQNWHRDYDPSTGRYLEADPIGLAGGINIFLYSFGNPVKFSDNLGLWPKIVHDKMIEALFPECNNEALKALKDGSDWVDSLWRGHQGPGYSYLHSTMDEGQIPGYAILDRDKYINGRIKDHNIQMSIGNTNAALMELGKALHPLMDATSPTHMKNGVPQSIANGEELVKHLRGETMEIYLANQEAYLNELKELIKGSGINIDCPCSPGGQ